MFIYTNFNTVLGNEQFIDKIIAENGTAAEKLVSRILSLDRALSGLSLRMTNEHK